MGSLPRLKIKTDLHYRKGPTWKGCGQCLNHTRKTINGIGEANLNREESRCVLIGLNESRRYRINTDYICDRWEGKP